MQGNKKLTLIIAILLGLSTGTGLAQNWVRKTQDPPVRIDLAKGQATYKFISSELSFTNEIVRGAPYSATAVTETTQVLGDGNRISRQTISRMFRDSDGRTRREQELPSIGSWVPDAGGYEVISINDPVAGVSYSLNPESMKAMKMSRPRFNVVMRQHTDGEGGDAPDVIVTGEVSATADFTSKENVFIERRHDIAVEPGRSLERIRVAPSVDDSEAVTESLGTRSFEGVSAEGTRSVVTIEAGAIGNELPIEIITERWYSEDLETVVMRRHYDPRFGETLFRLENIELSEPDPALFEVPGDFTIEEGGNSLIHLKKLHELRENNNQ